MNAVVKQVPTSRTIRSCTRGVLSIDTPDGLSWGVLTVGEPSPELLDRALVGWERYLNTKKSSHG